MGGRCDPLRKDFQTFTASFPLMAVSLTELGNAFLMPAVNLAEFPKNQEKKNSHQVKQELDCHRLDPPRRLGFWKLPAFYYQISNLLLRNGLYVYVIAGVTKYGNDPYKAHMLGRINFRKTCRFTPNRLNAAPEHLLAAWSSTAPRFYFSNDNVSARFRQRAAARQTTQNCQWRCAAICRKRHAPPASAPGEKSGGTLLPPIAPVGAAVL